MSKLAQWDIEEYDQHKPTDISLFVWRDEATVLSFISFSRSLKPIMRDAHLSHPIPSQLKGQVAREPELDEVGRKTC